MEISLVILLALFLDAILGEVPRWHPLAGFGNLANRLEQVLNNSSIYPLLLRLLGLLALVGLVGTSVYFFYLIQQSISDSYLSIIFAVVILYFTLGARSLLEHANRVKLAIQKNDLEHARQRVGMIVSRDTSAADENEISRATVESILENGNDAIFATIFWFVIAGVPGIITYRLVNTLDAMWGYKTKRFCHFGWAAARLDDVLNYIPARLTAISYALVGHTSLALKCWASQASGWKGVNPGVVMATGAGAMNIRLGGFAIYHGEAVNRPELGTGNDVSVDDISKANHLILKSIVLWVVVILLIGYLVNYVF